MWGLLQSIIVLFAFASVATSVVAQISFCLSRRWLYKQEPVQRGRILLALGYAPTIFPLVLIGIIFIPSLLTLLGFANDHCLSHGGFHFHLCFQHPPEFLINPWLLFISLLVLLIAFIKTGFVVFEILKLSSIYQQIRFSSELDPSRQFRIIESDKIIACSMGLAQGEIILSSSLLKNLSEQEVQIILTHEQNHISQKHSLKLLFASLFNLFYLKAISARLISDIILANEQSSDNVAASQSGHDRLLVAKTILKVQKLLGDNKSNMQLISNFSNDHIERRIRYLADLNCHSQKRKKFILGYLGFAMVVSTFIYYHNSIHHYIETMYFNFFS